jgi:hypothetical protein
MIIKEAIMKKKILIIVKKKKMKNKSKIKKGVFLIKNL